MNPHAQIAGHAPIRPLPPTLIDQIAAGEVIARPASVVKELIENALDADARRISIEIADDCLAIAVADDGVGIPADEIETALLRHATSKIASFEDIGHLQTRGFRGEALASIASVARVQLTSRTASSQSATRVEVVAGQSQGRHPIGAPPGTRVEVRDLFANVPARRKFLRSPQAELNAILRTAVQQALSQPEVGFTLERGEGAERRRVLDLPPEQTLRDRLAQVMGAEVAEHLVPLDLTRDDHLVTGFVVRPLVTRRDSRAQHFFVNGRPVTNARLGFALRQACAGMIMTGRQPIAAVFLECPPDSVDVNVHPTKDEVRFDHEDRVVGLVFRAVQAALAGTDLRPELRVAPPDAGKAPATPAGQPYSLPPGGPAPSSALPLQWGAQLRSEPAAPGSQAAMPLAPQAAGSPAKSIVDAGVLPPPVPPVGADEEMLPPLRSTEGALLDPLLTEELTIVPLGQIGDTYIVASCGDDMLVIDQHAAHERLVYHRVLERFTRQPPPEQPLMVPISFDLPATALSHLEEMTPIFRHLGIEMESFGGQTVIIRSLPSDFEKIDIVAVVQDVAADLERGGPNPTAEAIRDSVLTRIACHASVKANRRLSTEEMKALIDEIISARLPHTCPHGRPTMALLTRGQLDRQFKRH